MDSDDDQAAVMEVLVPYLERIYPVFPAALALYNEEYPSSVLVEHSGQSAAGNVNDHILAGLRRAFIDEPGFNFLEVRGLQVMNIRDAVVVRCKKVDENGRHRNYPTKQQRDFDRQVDIPGLPPEAARVVVGYQPDAAMSVV